MDTCQSSVFLFFFGMFGFRSNQNLLCFVLHLLSSLISCKEREREKEREGFVGVMPAMEDQFGGGTTD